MIEGKRVWIEDPDMLRIFYPKLLITDSIPLAVEGPLVIIGGRRNPFDFYPESIWVNRDAEYNLEDPSTLRRVVDSFRTIPEKYSDIWKRPKEEQWKFIREFIFLGRSISWVPEDEASVYSLFKALGTTSRAVFNSYIVLEQPDPVIISSLLTMLLKMQSRKDFVGVVSKIYMRDLTSLAKKLSGIRPKFMQYAFSPKDKTDLLHLLFSLKR